MERKAHGMSVSNTLIFDHLYILLIIDPAGYAHVQVARCEQSEQDYINQLGLSIPWKMAADN